MKIKVRDIVKLRKDVLLRHARSIPAYMGYTKEQFEWRDTLKKLEGKKGVVTKVFKSGYVNVDFGSTLIGINKSELVVLKNRKRKID